jgi:NAD(P)-dependent dehydrogenase (short-subunit alcohol dehydrogenase family)
MRMGRLDSKAAVIVGGSSGFGEGIAKRFLEEGAKVLIAARGKEELERVAKELNAEAITCDITRWDDAKATAQAALDRFGRLDVAVNCAGFEDNTPFARLKPDRVEKMVAVQFTGGLYFIQHMANAMQNGGAVITISSLTATLVAEGYAPYAGAKAGINHASKIAASEYGAQKVRVNVVSPTTIETPMVAKLFKTPGIRDAMVAETPLGDLPNIADVVNACLWLASDEAKFVTGENIHVDGGGQLRRLPRTVDFARAMEAAAAKS